MATLFGCELRPPRVGLLPDLMGSLANAVRGEVFGGPRDTVWGALLAGDTFTANIYCCISFVISEARCGRLTMLYTGLHFGWNTIEPDCDTRWVRGTQSPYTRHCINWVPHLPEYLPGGL